MKELTIETAKKIAAAHKIPSAVLDSMPDASVLVMAEEFRRLDRQMAERVSLEKVQSLKIGMKDRAAELFNGDSDALFQDKISELIAAVERTPSKSFAVTVTPKDAPVKLGFKLYAVDKKAMREKAPSMENKVKTHLKGVFKNFMHNFDHADLADLVKTYITVSTNKANTINLVNKTLPDTEIEYGLSFGIVENPDVEATDEA